jgi:SAM-dependent methyltransferase
MDRREWIAQCRAAVRADFDVEAPSYDEDPYPNEGQQEWVKRLLASVPAGGLVLDAPCGTGRYFPLVKAAGFGLVGVDQSAGMLAQARARGGADELHHVALQELAFVDRFDAAMTIDAMENVAPEDWPPVLGNVRRALRAGAQWYLTVEEHDRSEVERSHASLVAAGFPAVLGEVAEAQKSTSATAYNAGSGYHYYPIRAQVIEWIAAANLAVVDESYTPYGRWGYRHFLVRRVDR